MLRHAPLTALLVFVLGLATPAFARDVTALPDIGSSAAQVISPEEQKQYGEMEFREMRRLGYVLDDPLLEDWLQDVGNRLVANSNKPSLKFHFFLVRSRDINAFATLGGYVAINAGLILTTASEDELAGVMSHEIAHVTQNHILRGVEAQKRNTLPIALAMLAAVIVSSRSNSDTSATATQAAIAAGTGLLAQQQINFTRDNETEADHFGIQTMARAGYDPTAMATFFDRLQAAYRNDEGYGPYKAPDFLIDHPVTTTRISDALDRARQIKNNPGNSIPSGIVVAPSSLLLPANLSVRPADATPSMHRGRDFGWARERLRVLSAESSGAAIAEYTKLRAGNPSAFGDAQRYGLDLARMSHAEPEAALHDLQALAEKHPDAYWIELAIAKAEYLSGRRQEALNNYERMLQKWPRNRAVVLSYATTLGEIGTADAGRRAQAVLRPLTTEGENDPEFQQTFGRASELAGDTGRAGEAYATAAFLNGRAEDALNQLEALKRRSDIDYYQRARIDALIAQITPTVLELRKDHVRPQD
ncbi:MAG: M48 family metalloprotease, partial [Lysobacteraceae bacterium]